MTHLGILRDVAAGSFLFSRTEAGFIAEAFDAVISFMLNLPWIAQEFLQVNAKPLTQVLLLPGLAFILVFAIIAVWFERKFLARAMLRGGPYYCGKRSGLLQVFADFLKLFMKEIITPKDMNFLFFASMPVLF